MDIAWKREFKKSITLLKRRHETSICPERTLVQLEFILKFAMYFTCNLSELFFQRHGERQEQTKIGEEASTETKLHISKSISIDSTFNLAFI